MHPQTPHKVSDLDLKDAKRILLRSRTRQTNQTTSSIIVYSDRSTLVLSTDFLKAGVERRKLFLILSLGEVKRAKTKN